MKLNFEMKKLKLATAFVLLWSFLFIPSIESFRDTKSFFFVFLSAFLFSLPLLKKWSTLGFGIFIIAIGVVNIVHIRFFGTLVNEYSISSVSRTNSSESIGFFATIDFYTYFLMAAYLLVGAAALLIILRVQSRFVYPKVYALISAVVWVLFFAVVTVKGQDFFEKSHRIYPVNVFDAFLKSKKIDEAVFYKPVVERFHNTPVIDTLVVVIGESSSAARWSNLGYEVNQTNKPLDGVANSITLKAVANGPNTMSALPFMLLGESAIDANNNLTASFIDEAKENGYKTFVYTNSKFYDRSEDFFNVLLKRNADIYFKVGDGDHDEVLSDYLRNALLDKSERKLIVLHTYGSHPKVEDRYPDEFSIFPDAYDNSVFYTSSMLSAWIEDVVESGAPKPALVYMSDHGVTMPPCSDGYRLGYAKTSFEVPFFIWVKDFAYFEKISSIKPGSEIIDATSFKSLLSNMMGSRGSLLNLKDDWLSSSGDSCNVRW